MPYNFKLVRDSFGPECMLNLCVCGLLVLFKDAILLYNIWFFFTRDVPYQIGGGGGMTGRGLFLINKDV